MAKLAAVFIILFLCTSAQGEETEIKEPSFSVMKDAFIQQSGLWIFVYEGDRDFCRLCSARHHTGQPQVMDSCNGVVGLVRECATFSRHNDELRIMLPNGLFYMLPAEPDFMIRDNNPLPMSQYNVGDEPEYGEPCCAWPRTGPDINQLEY